MAKLTPDDILALADECAMENPRVIVRKLQSGAVALVLKFGPNADRREVVFDRSGRGMTAQELREVAAGG